MTWSPTPTTPERQYRTAWFLAPPAPDPREYQPAWFPRYRIKPSDTGIGQDLATSAPRILGADTGLGADRAVLTPTGLLIADTGLGADGGLIVPDFHATDAGAGADIARPGVRPADTGLGVDLGQARARYAAIDSAVGTDMLTSLKPRSSARDGGRGTDAATAGFTAHAAVPASYTAPGTFTYAIPVWCTYIELIGVGGGEGGDSGSGAFVAGAGGAAGLWNAITLQRGVDIPWTATTLTVVVGDGGTGGPAGPLNSDGAGGSPVVWSYGGTTLLTCPGGDNGGSGQNGKSPGNYTYNGVLYTGGAEQTSGSGSPGNPPGGGGRGGNGGFGVGLAGGKGAPGAGYARARQ